MGIRCGAVLLVAAAALLVPAAAAQACDLSAVGAKNAGDGGTNLAPGDSLSIDLHGIDEGARYSVWIEDPKAEDEVLVVLAQDEPAPDPRTAKPVAYPIGDLGDDPRDLDVVVQSDHSDGQERKPVTYVGKQSPAPSSPDDSRSGQPEAEQPLAPVPPPDTTSADDPAHHAPPPGVPTLPSGNGGGPSGPPVGGRPAPGGPSEQRTATADSAPAEAVDRRQAAPRTVAAAADTDAGRPVLATREPRQAAPAPSRRTVAPRPERADDANSHGSLPGMAAPARDDGVETDVPALIVSVLLAIGLAVVLRRRRRPAGGAEVVVCPAPHQPPSVVEAPAPDPIEAELQEILAEHAARTSAAPASAEGERDGPLVGTPS